LPSTCWPERAASARAIDTASVSASSVTATTPEATARMLSPSSAGADSGGRLAGSAPTVDSCRPCQALKAAAAAEPPSIATIM